MRTFTQAKLAERDEANRIARRHANFFSEFLQHDQIVQSRFGEHDLSGYASHIGNVRAALEWAFSDDGDVSVGVGACYLGGAAVHRIVAARGMRPVV